MWEIELNVSCGFGFCPGGGFGIGKAEGWPSFYVSPWGGWMRPPPPFLSFVLGNVAELRTVLRNAVCESTLALSPKIPEPCVRDGRCELF